MKMKTIRQVASVILWVASFVLGSKTAMAIYGWIVVRPDLSNNMFSGVFDIMTAILVCVMASLSILIGMIARSVWVD
jgi:ABC-type transport system involved in multi-copper enzyme maturation permease subunit